MHSDSFHHHTAGFEGGAELLELDRLLAGCRMEIAKRMLLAPGAVIVIGLMAWLQNSLTRR